MEITHASRPNRRHRHSGQPASAPFEQRTWRPDALPPSFAPEDLLQLQRTVGNQRVSHMLTRSTATSGNVRHTAVPWPALVTGDKSAPPSLRFIQRVLIDEEVQKALTEEEVKFFQAAPDVAAAEAKLQALMIARKPPITFELGLIYDGTTLKRVIKGTTASGAGGVASKDAQVEITSEAIAKALGIPPPGPGEEAKKFSTVVVTHNHPGGAPLSRADVAMAVGRGMREMRAVGKFGVFAVARLKETWAPITPDAVAEHFALGEQRWKSACPEKFATMKPMGQAPDIGENFAADNFMAKHYACVSLKKAFPGVLDYAHPDEQSLINARSNLYPIPGVESQVSKTKTTATSVGFAGYGGPLKQYNPLPGKKAPSNEM